MEPSVLKIFTVDLDWLRTLMGTKQWLLFWFRIRPFLKIRLIGLNNFFHNCPTINAVASTLPSTSPAQRAMGSWLRSPRVLLPAGIFLSGCPDRSNSAGSFLECFSQPSLGYILYESTYPPKLHFRSIQYVDLPNQEVMS